MCAKKATEERNLQVFYPAIAAQWHPTKNDALKSTHVLPHSMKKVWWLCDKGHEWHMEVFLRVRSHHECPTCKRLKRLSKNLHVLCPDLVSQWHPSKNLPHTPDNLCISKLQPIWWQCQFGHQWQTSLKMRMNGSGCPYCSGKRMTPEVSLKMLRPKIAALWHPTKNGKLKPEDVLISTRKSIYWQCKKGHEWRASLVSKMSYHCPICFPSPEYKKISTLTLRQANPDLAAQWHLEKNYLLTPDDVRAGSSLKVWWLCEEGHSWEACISSRNIGSGCPYCKGLYASPEYNLATFTPRLAKEWHPTKNGEVTPWDITPHAQKKYWWLCANGHTWEASANQRSSGRGCPYCSGQRPTKTYNLAVIHPKIAAKWHPTKNKPLTPTDVMPSSTKVVWWLCDKGHSWQEKILYRHANRPCPYCSGKIKTKYQE